MDNAPRPHAVFTQSPFKSFSVPSTFISLLTTPRFAVNCLINGAKKEESIVGFERLLIWDLPHKREHCKGRGRKCVPIKIKSIEDFVVR
ncbi:hypothetical protein CDAR_122611 [Caerostris darwini]|uniref:Uncharacterized protein n=1 Tax=Caerostris darwini TaxID=1538125 RepID=A0AAV4M916_9ARAC|nr:hypothetical protein CDAR_122611 [Caerostris darwini]